MNERNEPDDTILTPHERLTLRHIEADLISDRRLVRRMGQLRGPRPWRRLALSVAMLTCASLFLAVLGIRTSDPAVIWSFAALWPFTVLQAFRLLCRMSSTRDRFTSWL
ncbi:DUF3040 domain-containing protein [Streptomyces sp. NPDC057616]|uniref:DUF3040 domain-containing protein n=1 Tax=Streptomyces sp. NPDC057616 TaxID=3346183 RepID=UPI003675AF9E